MISVLEQHTQFNNLSVRDLLEARDLFHVHLMNKENVVGTALGRYRIRNEDLGDNDKIISRPKDYEHKDGRSLSNSRVVDQSWPCILVFVSHWVHRNEMKNSDPVQYVPPNIYMPDGRIVPICVVEAPVQSETDQDVDEEEVEFPDNVVSGGYPLVINSQGIKKIASAGCIVTDGNKFYVITNKHVTGTPGIPIYSKLRGEYKRIGITTDINIGNSRFQSVYDGWVQPNLFLNVDVGLIEIDDINSWKTDIYGLGPLGKVVDINVKNISLKLIGVNVEAHGAVSGKLEGEIAALFYRYKSIGGYEYISDFLIGPRHDQSSLKTKHGDSGTIWAIPPHSPANDKDEYMPVAIQWGQRAVKNSGKDVPDTFALATNLSHVCRDLDLDVVRGWNLDLDYTWGKTGHFKVGFAACDIVTNAKLKELLTANADRIGIDDADLIAGKVPPGMYTKKFIPMTDVADMYWRNHRPDDESNHFADMDDQDPGVYNNKTLLELCFTATGKIIDKWVDVAKWLDYYQQLDVAKPEKTKAGNLRPRLGGLPFRVWQMYNEMVSILKGTDSDDVKLAKFVTAGGTLSHYVGDACQPLHISCLHDGYPDGTGAGVHGAYERDMLDTYKKKPEANLLAGITALLQPVKTTDLVTGGRNIAKKVLSLMWDTYQLIPPKQIVDNYATNHSGKKLWEAFGEKTKQTIANGAHTMAVIWQSAWIEGDGDALTVSTTPIKETDLMHWYKKGSFVQSYKLNDPALKHLLV